MFHRSLYHGIKRFHMNPVVKALIVSDVIIWSASGLISPIFAIFVADMVTGGSIQAVGIAMGIYLGVKSVFELAVGWWIDRTPGERDDLYTSLAGTIGIAAVMFLYPSVREIWHVYVFQAALGIAEAFAYPGWCTIFTRHLDKDRTGFEWSIYDVSIGLGMALTAIIGGVLVEQYGFPIVFRIVGVMTLGGSIVLFLLRKQVMSRPRTWFPFRRG